MIEALYRWVNFKASELDITYDNFNNSFLKVCKGNYSLEDLENLYHPIKDLFTLESEPPEYVFQDQNGNTLSNKQMKYLLFPRRDLFGKAKQSFGRAQFASKRDKLPSWLKEEKGRGAKVEIKETTVKTKRGKSKKVKERVFSIPTQSLPDIFRKRLFEIYFLGKEPKVSNMFSICPFCGNKHSFENLRIEFPINIYTVNIANYTSYLSRKGHSICPYCCMLFLRSLTEENGPWKIPFASLQQAYIYLLPFDPSEDLVYECFSKQQIENILKKELEERNWDYKEDALEYMLTLPVLIYKNLPLLRGKANPSIYVAFAIGPQGREAITDIAIITRFDFLAKVGECLFKYNWFDSLYSFKKRLKVLIEERKDAQQKANAYKLIFRFLSKMLEDAKIDYVFLKNLLRKEIMQSKRNNQSIKIFGYNYLKAFLEGGKNG